MTAIQVSLKGGLLLQIQQQYIFFPFILVTKTFLASSAVLA